MRVTVSGVKSLLNTLNALVPDYELESIMQAISKRVSDKVWQYACATAVDTLIDKYDIHITLGSDAITYRMNDGREGVLDPSCVTDSSSVTALQKDVALTVLDCLEYYQCVLDALKDKNIYYFET